MAFNSPLARAGLSMLEASIAPSAAPAPIKVWSSSINKIYRPAARLTSLKRDLILSSNSPRYFVPAIKEPRSKAIISLSLMDSGMSPVIILWAKPSAIAVLPTPASPIKTGLFFVLLDRTCINLLISPSRPMTGSSFLCRAKEVRLRVYFSITWYFVSGSGSVILWPPRIWANCFKNVS